MEVIGEAFGLSEIRWEVGDIRDGYVVICILRSCLGVGFALAAFASSYSPC
jgi:hypothetical protein